MVEMTNYVLIYKAITPEDSSITKEYCDSFAELEDRIGNIAQQIQAEFIFAGQLKREIDLTEKSLTLRQYV